VLGERPHGQDLERPTGRHLDLHVTQLMS
jgi:hypothetical protein